MDDLVWWELSAQLCSRPWPTVLTSISIHALRTECDFSSAAFLSLDWIFQSTHPRGVRYSTRRMLVGAYEFQSTHSARSATRVNIVCRLRNSISIHALRTECDLPKW